MRVQRQIDQLLAQRAAEWVEALKSGDRATHVSFLEWLRQSKLHVEHYLETEALDRHMQALDRARGPDIEAMLARIAPQALPLRRDLTAGGAARSMPRIWSVAATLAILAIGAAMFWGLRDFVFSANRVITAVGEQRNVTLPDGSRLSVNALSSLRINYSSRARDIELIEGEAVFDIAPDPARPFTVRTRTVNVRALGTQFNVNLRSDDTAIVSVLEGRVQITRLLPSGTDTKAAAKPEIENLSRGEEAQITAQRIERRTNPDIGKALAWREGRLFFDETPLTEMVQEFNRYGGPLHLELEGKGFERYRFGGVFNAGEPGVLVDILERQKDLSVERRADGTVIIRPNEIAEQSLR